MKILRNCLLVLLLIVISILVVNNYIQLNIDNSLLYILILSLTALLFSCIKKLSGFAYTMWIIVGIALGLLYPKSFDTWGNFDLEKLIIPFVQLTMFGMGAQMSFDDFKGIIKMPKGVITGLVCQFTIMPLVGFILAKIFNLPSEIAAGVVLIGCVPSAMASNVMSYLAKANLALSVTIGATATILAPVLTPILMNLLGGQYIEIDIIGMMSGIIDMIIVPIIAGFIFNLYYANNKNMKTTIIQMATFLMIIICTNILLFYSANMSTQELVYKITIVISIFYILPIFLAIILRHSSKISYPQITSTLAFFAMLGIVINTIIITASGYNSLINVGSLLLLSCLLHNVAGFLIGYSAATIVGLPLKDRRTIAFEVGMQNGGVATGLALQMGKVATVGLASAIFGPLQNLTGSSLVNLFKYIDKKSNRFN